MTKIIAVTGATGSQGGGVVNVMKKTPGWTVRAVTRNPESEAAKKLAAEGVEVVKADMEDEESLRAAFKASLCLARILFPGSSPPRRLFLSPDPLLSQRE
jgi:uncharacterized protein YbjT (DUF2867 family)